MTFPAVSIRLTFFFFKSKLLREQFHISRKLHPGFLDFYIDWPQWQKEKIQDLQVTVIYTVQFRTIIVSQIVYTATDILIRGSDHEKKNAF